MSDVFSAILTFSVLAGGTAAIGTEMFTPHYAEPARPVVTLPTVRIVAHRQVDTRVVMLPRVTITGHRAQTTRLAAAIQASEPTRVQ
jgi:hypothetical protein